MRIFKMIKTARGGMFLGLALMTGMIFSLQPKAEALTPATNLQLNINSESNKAIQTTKQAEQGQESDKKSSIEPGDKAKEEEDNPAEEGMTFKATAYCLKGRTASGLGVRRGIVAADPRVFPLGSTITISAGQYSGTYLVADTGGGVKGKKIDIWVPSCSEAFRFGKRTIKVALTKKEDI